MTTKGFTPETEAAYASAVELFEQGTDAGQQYHVLRGLASLYMFRGEVDEMTRLGRQILALGEDKDDPTIRIDGHLLIGTGLMFFDDLRGGLDELDTAIALFPAIDSRSKVLQLGNDSRISCLTTSALTLWLLGYPDGAAQRADAALALAAQLEHPFSSAYARFHAGLVRVWRRDSEVALDLAAGLCEFAQEHEFRIWMAAGGCLLGALAQAQAGRFNEGLASIGKGIERYEELRSPPIFYPLLLSLQARANAEAARPADGRQALDSAIEILDRGGRNVDPARDVCPEGRLPRRPPGGRRRRLRRRGRVLPARLRPRRNPYSTRGWRDFGPRPVWRACDWSTGTQTRRPPHSARSTRRSPRIRHPRSRRGARGPWRAPAPAETT